VISAVILAWVVIAALLVIGSGVWVAIELVKELRR
jgi:hypothetical protein